MRFIAEADDWIHMDPCESKTGGFYVSHQPPQNPTQRGYGTVQGQQAPAKNSGAQSNQDGGNGSSSANPPPTYAEAVKGDNKVQSQE